MAVRHLVDRTELLKHVEKQMRNWELLARVRRAAESGSAPPATTESVYEFVSLSREVGAGGYEVAARLGERLGWPVFDREILQAMAGDDRLRARIYQTMDERDTTWLESVVRWLIQGELRRDDYFRRLSETVLALARRSHAVFLGRGTDLILPAGRGLRVRITAPEAQRVRNFAGRHRLAERAARAEMERVARERAEFIRNHFNREDKDLLRFDLVVNLGRLTTAGAVELILAALRQRGAVA